MRRSDRRPSFRRPRKRWIVVTLVVLGIVGAAIGLTVAIRPSWLGSGHSSSPSAAPTVTSESPTCASARAAGSSPLGTLAWIDGDSLMLFDLDSCARRTLVPQRATPPVRFSPDGRWVGFGDGNVVPAAGGEVSRPLGAVTAWQWSPGADLLAGVTTQAGVVVGGPDSPPRPLLPDGSAAAHLVFSPDGDRLAVDVGGDRIEVLDVADGSATTIYRVSPGLTAPPQVADWSRDGDWVLFWSRFPGKAGVPLNAAPAAGGNWVNVFDPVLPYADFLTWCGRDLAFAGGAAKEPSVGNQVLVSRPPGWRFHDLSVNFAHSWIWPACSPDGTWIAVSASANVPQSPLGQGVRSLWLLATNGSRRVQLTDDSDAAYELPRWSPDGRFVLVVRRGLDPASPGAEMLFPIDPSSGTPEGASILVASLGSSPGEGGHATWSDITDWYRQG
jgi:dipeptidyl aminopeptidase/acylaminoacyl peptidase